MGIDSLTKLFVYIIDTKSGKLSNNSFSSKFIEIETSQ